MRVLHVGFLIAMSLTIVVALKAVGVILVVAMPVSYTHLRAHETVLDLVCRLLLEKKKFLNSTSHILLHTEHS